MNYSEEEKKTIKENKELGIVFITLGLNGALDDEAILNLKLELEQEIQNATLEGQISSRIRRIKKVFFSKIDSLLDSSVNGPQWLKKYDFAKMIIGELEILCEQDIKLVSYTVMPNHLHLIFEPLNNCTETQINNYIEGFKQSTSNKAKEFLGNKNDFWIQDHHVHLIHDQKELINIISYVLENPVKTGLVDYWRDWPWTYCNPDYI